MSEEYLTEDQISKLKEEMLELKLELSNRIRSVIDGNSSVERIPDDNEASSNSEAETINTILIADDEKKIVLIDFALDLIKKGDYGFCLDCGDDIKIKRLQANPTASRCTPCQTNQEFKLKNFAMAS
jgi:DnaK suppressor protein